MARKTPISESWLADRAGLHDARTHHVSYAENTLSIGIDHEWPNLATSYEAENDPSGGWLIFKGADILSGSPEAVSERFISELKFIDGSWLLYLARERLVSRRDLLAFRADAAYFHPEA